MNDETIKWGNQRIHIVEPGTVVDANTIIEGFAAREGNHWWMTKTFYEALRRDVPDMIEAMKRGRGGGGVQ